MLKQRKRTKMEFERQAGLGETARSLKGATDLQRVAKVEQGTTKRLGVGGLNVQKRIFSAEPEEGST